jgi:hypothetical protein
MNREEHLAWSKQRALDELPNPATVIASIQSDLRKHPELESHMGLELMMLLAMSGHLSTPYQVKEFIEGLH